MKKMIAAIALSLLATNVVLAGNAPDAATTPAPAAAGTSAAPVGATDDAATKAATDDASGAATTPTTNNGTSDTESAASSTEKAQ